MKVEEDLWYHWIEEEEIERTTKGTWLELPSEKKSFSTKSGKDEIREKGESGKGQKRKLKSFTVFYTLEMDILSFQTD